MTCLLRNRIALAIVLLLCCLEHNPDRLTSAGQMLFVCSELGYSAVYGFIIRNQCALHSS